MAERSYPRDAIGNAIKVGDLLQVTLPRSTLIFRVVNVDPAGSIQSPGQPSMALTGTLYMQALIPVPFTEEQPLNDMLVLKQPEGPQLSPSGTTQ